MILYLCWLVNHLASSDVTSRTFAFALLKPCTEGSKLEEKTAYLIALDSFFGDVVFYLLLAEQHMQ